MAKSLHVAIFSILISLDFIVARQTVNMGREIYATKIVGQN